VYITNLDDPGTQAFVRELQQRLKAQPNHIDVAAGEAVALSACRSTDHLLDTPGLPPFYSSVFV
jgi:hypothetical protein